MKPRDWYLLLAGPALCGLAVMGCTDANASKPPKASRSTAPAATSGDSAALAEVDPDTIVLSVPSMTWPVNCPLAVREALMACRDVTDVKVDFQAKTAKVKVEGKVDTRKLIAAVDAAGFRGAKVKE